MDNNDYIKARGEKGGCKEREKAKQERQRWREKANKEQKRKEREEKKHKRKTYQSAVSSPKWSVGETLVPECLFFCTGNSRIPCDRLQGSASTQPSFQYPGILLLSD